MEHIKIALDGGETCFCEACKGVYFDFLHRLRDSAQINMFGAPSVLREVFPEMTKEESYQIFEAWTNTFRKKSQPLN